MAIHRGWTLAFEAAIVLLLVFVVVMARGDRALPPGDVVRLVDHTRKVQHLDTLRASQFVDGQHVRTIVEGDVLRLNDTRKTFPRRGSWTSPVINAAFPMDELLPSWNPICPPDTGVTIELRVRDRHYGEWSPWLYLGQWGRTQHKVNRAMSFRFGEVKTDELILTQPADAYQVRIGFEHYGLTDEMPALRRVSVSYVGPGSRRPSTDRPLAPADWARDLPVPFLPQGDGHPLVTSEICSPTSTAMVMSYRGVPVGIMDNALAIYDREHEMFGNWSRAVARAGEAGLDSYLMHILDWEQAKAYIARGQPIIASIRFREGTFPSNVMKQTSGHLIVIRGFTP
ncbi:MAG TPA: C39 family peptidase, partial [Tepidisphaeraceae bacterium]|nr:C39 family peptidase [Tepidisphaeraceae bacterium]